MAPNREDAERVILEILKQAGGSLGKTKVFKAFWLAHLFYSKSNPSFLTDWPIVRMPNGPGIDRGNALLRDLVVKGAIDQSDEQCGPYTETRCELVPTTRLDDLPESAIAAIQLAVKQVQSRSAAEISEWSHDFSRAWNSTANGQELDIYSDLITDDEFEERAASVADLKKTYEGLFE